MNMKKLLWVLLAVLLIVSFYWLRVKKDYYKEDVKNESIKVTAQSDVFNQSFDTVLNNYFSVKAALVEADTSTVKSNAVLFLNSLNRLPIGDIQKNSPDIYGGVSMLVNDLVLNTQRLLTQTDIVEMRQDFRMVSENLYPLLKTIHYTGAKVYWQTCPMAFGKDQGANWLSNTAEILNPYLGKKHPIHKDKMLDCGEIVDSIQSTK